MVGHLNIYSQLMTWSWMIFLISGDHFSQTLEHLILPLGLQDLTFGNDFNQALEEAFILPAHLQSLKFGHHFNRSLSHVDWPKSLRTLAFGESFDQNFETWSGLPSEHVPGFFP